MVHKTAWRLVAYAWLAGCGDDTVPAAGAEPKPMSGASAPERVLADAGGPTRVTSDAAVEPMLDQDAATAPSSPAWPAGAVSRPGEYSGFGDKRYDGFALSSEYVAVRDGTKLAVDLYRPKTADGQVVSEPLPVLWMHTPYNRRTFGSGSMSGLAGETYPGAAARLIPYGYVVAIADYRGLYASYGVNEGYNRGEWLEAARLDAYDITEWLAKQPWSTGKIGMWGCSATGGSQLQATTTAPPSLKAVFPMSCEFDAYPFGVPGGMAPTQGATRAPPTTVSPALRDQIAEPIDGDSERTQLRAAIDSHGPDRDNLGVMPFRDSLVDAAEEPWWLVSSPHTYLDAINASGVALYLAANWDEAATKYGAFFTFNNVTTPSKLIVGPASHCAWFTVQQQTGFDIAVEERRFFDHWLKGIDNGVMDEPRVYYFTYGAPAGREWTAATAWPPLATKLVPYYLGAKTLSTTAPSTVTAADDFTVDYEASASDPASHGLIYETATLERATQITGHAVVDLWLTSTANDSDLVAYVQNVAPDGSTTSYNMHGRLRASQRKEDTPPYNNLGLPWHPFREADAQPLVPGEPAHLRFDILPFSMVFEAGHKIRLVLTFADTATPRVTPAPRVSVLRDLTHLSTLTLPVPEE